MKSLSETDSMNTMLLEARQLAGEARRQKFKTLCLQMNMPEAELSEYFVSSRYQYDTSSDTVTDLQNQIDTLEDEVAALQERIDDATALLEPQLEDPILGTFATAVNDALNPA